MDIIKNTPFTDKHLALKAKMAQFAGYNMPISYTHIMEEHLSVRNNAGLFDISHMGEFILSGSDSLDLIQRVTSNDASKLKEGEAQYSCLPNLSGGIVDDLLVYCLKENAEYLLVVNASNIEKDWNWISQFNDKGVQMENISSSTCLLAVQGPKATLLMQPLTDVDILNLKYYTFAIGKFAGVDDVIVSATGYTGAGGIEIYFRDENKNADVIWNAIIKEGSPHGLIPVGLGARDTLRLEMGFCLYGNDIDDQTSPLEGGLSWITKFNKADFNAKDILLNQKASGLKRKLIGFELTEKGIPRHGYKIMDKEGHEIGHVTSGTHSPSLNKGIGLGYVSIEWAKLNTVIFIEIRNKLVAAKIVKPPFFTH